MSTGVWVCSVQCDRHLGLPSLWIVPCGCETRCRRSWLCLQELLHFEEFRVVTFQRPLGLVGRDLSEWRTLAWYTPGIRLVLLTSCCSILSNKHFNYHQRAECVISCYCISLLAFVGVATIWCVWKHYCSIQWNPKEMFYSRHTYFHNYLWSDVEDFNIRWRHYCSLHFIQ